MLGLVHSASLLGVHGHAVTVEVHTTGGGLPSFTVVGSPDSACREARDRVRAAIESSSLKWPMERVTVNLAPPTVRQVGSGLDLALAIRSEERRVGNECVSPCRSRGSPYH